MKASNCDLNELWQEVCLKYSGHVPLRMRLWIRLTHRLCARWGR